MISRHNQDGTWTELTDEEFIAQEGWETWRWVMAPLDPAVSEMAEGQVHLAYKRQVQAELNSALHPAGIESLDNLPRRPDSERRRVEFRIDGLHGERVERFSLYPEEFEAMFRIGTEFQVLGRYERNGNTYILMEEMDDTQGHTP